MKFDALNRWTGAVQFTAEIDCAEDAPRSVKMGLAVRWGRENGANLAGANLADANLAGAYLAGANLAGAKWRDGIVLTRVPLQVYGLDYPVTILDSHMQIGCELHSLAEWVAFDNERIAKMDGRRARKFWDAHKTSLFTLALGDGRPVAPVPAETTEVA